MSSDVRRAPVFVLGFDAMDPATTRQMARRGDLPAFASVFERGATVELRTPPGLLVGGVWPSYCTGSWPSHHGFYSFRQFMSGTYAIRRFDPRDVADQPFWVALAAAGRRVCIVDAPLAPPTQPADGVHIVDWGTHDRMLEPAAWPEAVATELATMDGHPVASRCDDYAEHARWSALLEDLVAGVEAKTRLNLSLLDRADWDCFVTVYSECHCAGHHLWATHAGDRSDLGIGATDGVERVYRVLDDGLASMLAQIPDDAVVLVLLSHGFGLHNDADHLVSQILARLDDALGPPSQWARRREQALRIAERARHRWQRGVPPRMRSVVSVDSGRRFFKIPNNDFEAGIRINLRGREPRGRVEPGTELESLLAWLERELLELREPDRGTPLVRQVMRTADRYSGPKLDALPDLIVDWERSAPILGAESARIGTLRGRPHVVRSGDHRPGGVLVGLDPRLSPGRAGTYDVVDLAPTLCRLLGVELAGVDGEPIPAFDGAQR